MWLSRCGGRAWTLPFISESHLTFDPHLESERGGKLLSSPPISLSRGSVLLSW